MTCFGRDTSVAHHACSIELTKMEARTKFLIIFEIVLLFACVASFYALVSMGRIVFRIEVQEEKERTGKTVNKTLQSKYVKQIPKNCRYNRMWFDSCQLPFHPLVC